MVVVRVVEVVRVDPRELGFTEGLHAEGAVFNSLLCLLLWDQVTNLFT